MRASTRPRSLQASAGATLCATRLHRKLNGEIAPTTPIGTRNVIAIFPAPAGDASIGTTSPASLRASTAAIVNVETARAASIRAALDRLSSLGADRPGDLLRSLFREPCSTVEDRGALVCRQRIGHRTLSRVDSLARLVRACPRDPPDERAVVGRQHIEPVAGLDPLARDQQLLLGRRGGHGVSVVGHFRGMDVPEGRIER